MGRNGSKSGKREEEKSAPGAELGKPSMSGSGVRGAARYLRGGESGGATFADPLQWVGGRPEVVVASVASSATGLLLSGGGALRFAESVGVVGMP